MADETGATEAGEVDDPEDIDNEEQNVSLAAMEMALLPQVLVTFEQISVTYKRLHKVQVQRLDVIRRGEEAKPALEKRFAKLRRELATLLQDVHLHNLRIEELVGQLYDLNRKLIGLEGRLMRLALDCRVKREDFLEHYRSHELTAGLAAPDQPAARQGLGQLRQPLQQRGGANFAARSRSSPTRRRCRSANSAASSRPCRRASARPARPRRR